MQLGKQAVIEFIEREVGGEQARSAARQLPDQVDHERHGALLRQFGVDLRELAQRLGAIPDGGAPHGDTKSQGPGTQGTVTGAEDDYDSGDEASRTRARL